MAGIERRIIFLYEMLDRIKTRGLRHHRRCGCHWRAGVLTNSDGSSIPDKAQCIRSVHRKWDRVHRFKAMNGSIVEIPEGLQ